MTRITTLLFDVDGTLVDSNDLHIRAWQAAFREAGHQVDAAAIHHQVGKGGDHLVPSLLPDIGADAQRRIAEAHGPHFRKFIGQVRPFPGARDLLARAKARGLIVSLATSAKQEELDHHLDLLDARDLIDVATSADDADHTKPDPDIFCAALAKTGAEPDQALVIGDSPYDVIAARRAGIAAIGLLSGGFREHELRGAGALAVYRDAADLLANWDASPIRSNG